MPEKNQKRSMRMKPMGFILGIAVGVAISVALDNYAVGMGVGAAIAVALGMRSPTPDSGPDDTESEQ